MTTPPADATEHALRDYVDSYCQSYRRLHNVKSYNGPYKHSVLDLDHHFDIQREGNILTLKGPSSKVRNVECKKEIAAALMEVEQDLRKDGFIVGTEFEAHAEAAAPSSIENEKFGTKVKNKLKTALDKTFDAIAGETIQETEREEYRFHIELDAPHAAEAISKLQQKTVELKKGHEEYLALQEAKDVTRAIASFANDIQRLPATPRTEIGVKTIAGLKKMAADVGMKKLVKKLNNTFAIPETLATGNYTDTITADRLSQSAGTIIVN